MSPRSESVGNAGSFLKLGDYLCLTIGIRRTIKPDIANTTAPIYQPESRNSGEFDVKLDVAPNHNERIAIAKRNNPAKSFRFAVVSTSIVSGH